MAYVLKSIRVIRVDDKAFSLTTVTKKIWFKNL